MGRTATSRTRLTVAIACALLAPAAWAQDAKPASPVERAGESRAEAGVTSLGAVKVTARKREETLQDVPVAVTAFTADALDKLAIDDLGDLDAQVPNLTVYAARGSTSTVTAYIRGVGQADPLWGVDPGVGIYLDDVYIARPQGALLDVFDVERVEVLRGPQGTLYGKNTIGGAIKYISRGLPTSLDGFASVTAGNYNQLDVKAAVGGPIGGADSGLRARVAVASLNRDGFGENLLNGQDVSDKEITAARFSLGAYAGDDLDIQFAFDWVDDQSGVRGAQMLTPNPFAPAFPPLASRYDIRSGMRNVNDTEVKGASATVNWRANADWTLKYVIAKRESDSATNIDFDTTPLEIVDVFARYYDDQVSHELQANFDAGGMARGVVGLYAFDGDAGGVVQNIFSFPGRPPGITNPIFGDTRGEVGTESIAVYADWSFDLGDRLELNLGARYTDEDKNAFALNRFYTDRTYTVVGPLGTAANFDRTVSFQNVSPKIAVNYELTPEVMVYGLATRGFKSGGYNIRANTTAVPRSGEPFDDEVVDSFEVGSKMALLDNRLFLNLAAFHNKYEDIQLSVFTSFTLPNGQQSFFGDFTNAGEGTVNGVEIEYQFLPTANWAISGNFAWLDAEYDEFISRGINIADTQFFTNAPEFSGAVNVEYRTQLASGADFSARVGYSYQDEVYPTTDLSPLIRQDGYGLVNATVSLRLNEAWSFQLQGTNLADEEYRTTGYNIGAYGIVTGFYGAPRQVSLSARYDF